MHHLNRKLYPLLYRMNRKTAHIAMSIRYSFQVTLGKPQYFLWSDHLEKKNFFETFFPNRTKDVHGPGRATCAATREFPEKGISPLCIVY